MTPPLVYVLIINWNGMDHVQACFASLLQSPYPNVRYVLLDNGSTDGSDAYVEQTFGADPRVLVWRLGENLGWSPGNNEGIRRAIGAGADFIFLLNNDTWTNPTSLDALVTLAQAHPKAGALAPKMVLFDTPSVLNSFGVAISYVGAAWDIGVGRADGPAWQDVREVPAVCGGAMFLRVSALKESGLLDPDYGIYYDDVDLCLRLWQRGWSSITCPQALVGHKFSASFSGSVEGKRRKHFLTERNRLRCLLLNFPWSLLFRFIVAIKVAELRAFGSALRDGQWWRAAGQAKAWGTMPALWLALPRLRRERRFYPEYTRKLLELLTRDHMFCPTVVLPHSGVYPAQPIEGAVWHPVAPEFSLRCPGELRLAVLNCYLQKVYEGPVSELVDSLSADGVTLHWNGQALSFASDTVRTAEESGFPHDTGGYLQLSASTGSPLDMYALAPEWAII